MRARCGDACGGATTSAASTIPAIPYTIRAIPTLHRVTRALQLASLAAASSAAHDSP